MQTSRETFPLLTPDMALFLDFDGTLVALAPRPELVQVPLALTGMLATLYRQLDGALAVVSGRQLSDLDDFLKPLQLSSAGEHGAQRRTSDGLMVSAPPPDLQQALLAANDLVARHAGLRLERKRLALSLHYRQAPELEDLCLEVMREAVSRNSALELMQGKCVIDIKPAGFSKGTAIDAFMNEAPFAGRLPIFAGDDVTDEAGFAAVQRLGGHAIKVGTGPTQARHRCDSVADFADWLQSAVDTLGKLSRPSAGHSERQSA